MYYEGKKYLPPSPTLVAAYHGYTALSHGRYDNIMTGRAAAGLGMTWQNTSTPYIIHIMAPTLMWQDFHYIPVFV